jgi:GDP-L-fucose synthase
MMGQRKIFVAGHRGMVGSAIIRRLGQTGEHTIVADRSELDLRNQFAVEGWLARNRPDVVILAAAKVGGIQANAAYPVDFLIDNLAIQTNVIRGSHLADVNRLIFLGSSCIYPKFAPQPITEESLLTGPLEPTNEWYAIAKIAGIKMCQAYRRQFERRYIAIMPCNLYGPNDNFDAESGHVLPALIRKFNEAKRNGSEEVVVWGTGKPLREFLHVDDLARAVTFCMDHFDAYEHINCGAGSEISIRDLAELVREVVGFRGRIVFDPTRPDGTPRKLMNSDRLRSLGWAPSIGLREGVVDAYDWFLKHRAI